MLRTKNLSEFIKLYESGLSQKEISISMGVTEKTVGTWVKKYQSKNLMNIETLEFLNIRLNEISKNPNTPIIDIYNLSNSITMVRRSIFYNMTIKENGKNKVKNILEKK